MADQVLLMEARMKDLISGELNKVEKNLKDVDKGAKKSFGSAQKSANSFGNTLKGFVGAQAIIGGVRTAWRILSGTVKDSVALYGAQVQAETQLSQALGYTSESLLTQASALQQLTIFGDEETIQAQALIGMFVKEESQIKKVIPLVQDFAAAKGLKLAVAADLVSKTLGSSTNALTRYGIQVTGAVGSEERLATMTNSLSKAFKGQAEAIAKTGTGPLKQYSMAVGDLQEKFGKIIVEAILPFVNVLRRDVLPVLSDVLNGIDQMMGATAKENNVHEQAILVLIRLRKRYRGIRDEQLANKKAFALGELSVRGGMYDPEVLKNAEIVIERTTAKIIKQQKLAHGLGSTPPPGAPPPGAPAGESYEDAFIFVEQVREKQLQLDKEYGEKTAAVSAQIAQAEQELLEYNEEARLEKLQECKDKEDKIRQEANDKMLEIEKISY